LTRLAVHSNAPLGAVLGSSTAIRSYQLARALAPHFDVTLSIPNEPGFELENVEVVQAPLHSPRALARELGAFESVVAQRLPFATMRRLATGGVRVIYDVYPFWPEGLAFLQTEGLEGEALVLARAEALAQRGALLTGSAFVCTSDRQRDFWLGMLHELGRLDLASYRRDRSFRQLIDVVPFGLPPEPPVKAGPAMRGVVPGIGAQDRILLWAGGVNWCDPMTVIRAVAELAKRRSDVRLVFLGLDPPPCVTARRSVELARTLGVLGNSVFFLPRVRYDERQGYLLESDVGVSAFFNTLEHRLAFRARLLDYFWADLPTLTTRGDVLGDRVAQEGLGRALDFEDVQGWANAIEEVVDDREERALISARLDRVREELAWPEVVRPLVGLARVPGKAADVGGRLVAASVADVVSRARVSYRQRGLWSGIGHQAGRVAGAATRLVRRRA
jgi:glycosyltransferase involved in cell wall biosynthesis